MNIERGDRRVDVDDLVALALALGVSPNRLLLPDVASGAIVDLAPNYVAQPDQAWAWATGDAPLANPWAGPLGQESEDDRIRRAGEFAAANRLHESTSLVRNTVRNVLANAEVLRPVWEAAQKARRAGVPAQDIAGFIEIMSAMQDDQQGGEDGQGLD
ncbi:helix-turn-helix domain-containing protein [Kitasatospora cineracea]|uniref:helix-turn-helix domain-containing protein n=1 Tax=Kitasatospora cineracea TaxID=88074 RepID=UPI001ABFF168|nr:helix-turn-helix transcriptional regulator [Kitasatospora cineracea]